MKGKGLEQVLQEASLLCTPLPDFDDWIFWMCARWLGVCSSDSKLDKAGFSLSEAQVGLVGPTC